MEKNASIVRGNNIHINSFKFEEKDAWTRQFNLCSSLYQDWIQSGKEELLGRFINERQRLELGYYE